MKLSEFNVKKDILSGAELNALIQRFNDNASDYPTDKTVHALFAMCAMQSPDAPAVLHEDEVHSYGELDRESNRFARLLVDLGVERDQRVAVMLEKPFEMVAALLGVLKAGGAYVPIDYDAPYERSRYLIEDTGARVLVSEKSQMRKLNKLLWDCANLQALFCADSWDIHAEPEGMGAMMQESLWDHVGQTMFDDISGGGWTSSYTGEWLSRAVMDEYGDNIAAKLEPFIGASTRILEIATASGISLFRLAPRAGFYYGTDLSWEILRRTEAEVQRRGLSNIRLRHLPAHEICRIKEDGFHVVVLNSVIQCFSGHNYLRQVIRQAIDRMADRGVIFLGNLWDQDKKGAFIESLVEFRSRNADRGYRTKVDRYEELFVARAFLEDLRHDFPEILSVDCSNMIGRERSELSEYGYDAILHIDRNCCGNRQLRGRNKHELDLRALSEYPDTPLQEHSGPDGLAYVIYTSGTSGQPKGVMIEHRSILRLVLKANYLQLNASDRCLQTGSLAFDASTFEIWGPLLNGGVFCRPPERAVLNPSEMSRLIAKHRITTLWLTASLFNQHVDTDISLFAGLKHLLIGGEKLSVHHVNRVREKYPELVIINGYGPTENTTFTTCHHIDQTFAVDIPIGQPVANTQVWILDGAGNLAAIGMAGEICASGDGLARGYLNDEDLTRQKFQFHKGIGRRLYHTGDLGRWMSDGTVEYLGRIDDQVKIRGYRVEPSEIERHLQKDPLVTWALVLARNLGGPSSELVAYVTGDNQLDMDGLRERLKDSLPDYMVPSFITRLDHMPLSANGKVDRSKLPLPDVEKRVSRRPYEAPATETEKQLAEIWNEVLGRERVGVTDNFFDSGGHSLKVAKTVALIEQELGVALPLTALFTYPTVRSLARFILDGAKFGIAGMDEALVPLNLQGVGMPVFGFPPGTGDALGYLQLAERLRPYRFYGFNFIEAESRLRDYADLIVSTDPVGPYLLFGYSSGGNLAYRVAHELEDRGLSVLGVLMLDSTRRLEEVRMTEEEVTHIAAMFLGDESVRPYLDNPLLAEKAERLVLRSLDYVQQAIDYHHIHADIHVITSENPVTEFRDKNGRLLVSLDAWQEVTSGIVSVYRGMGHHNYMLAHPYLEPNADLLRGLIDKMVLA